MRFGRAELTIPLSQAKFRSSTHKGRKTQGKIRILPKNMSFRHFVPKSLANCCPHTRSSVGTIYPLRTRNRAKTENRRNWKSHSLVNTRFQVFVICTCSSFLYFRDFNIWTCHQFKNDKISKITKIQKNVKSRTCQNQSNHQMNRYQSLESHIC